MSSKDSLADVKRRISTALRDAPDVTGVGLRAGRVVVYLARDDEEQRRQVERVAHAIAPEVAVRFEVTGRFDKQ